MNPERTPRSPLAAWMLLAGVLLPALAMAQQTRHWVGGSGAWNDRAHWAATAAGAGGASVPGARDAVVIAPRNGAVAIALEADQAVGDLHVDGSRGHVSVEGRGGALRVEGDFSLKGSVAWDHAAAVGLFPGKSVCELDLRGIPLPGGLLLEGGGTWSMRSDLVLGDRSALDIRGGTLATNGNMLRAGRLRMAGHGAHLSAGSSVIWLESPVASGLAPGAVDPGTSKLIVGGAAAEWGPEAGERGDERAMNVCATGVGQTVFTIDAQLLSNYNGFGVSCHGVCNGQVRVVATGGIGPFTYSWVGGPGTATWNNVCPGNQIVIVTDQGQGVSCATTVQVTDPASLSVIFAATVPPTCAGVCNGSSSVFAVGGVPGYSYSWNNGAGTGASFNQLCPGANALHVADGNNCAFDTTFLFPVQAIQPNLTFTDALCADACNGTASVAPAGGTAPFTFNWLPGNPAGDGTNAVTGLCAGPYSVTLTDANGCDTTLQFQINEPAPVLPHESHTDASCGGLCDGTATVAPAGGSGTFTFSWAPAPGAGQGTASATGLCEGSYAVTITDAATGCDTVVAIVIDAPPTLLPHPASTDATCANACDATATVAPAGGTPPYTYTWAPAPPVGQGTASAAQLCPGIWSVTISDGATCDTTVQFTIQAPPPLSPAPAQTDVSCAGACDGTASAPATGGTGPLTYNWMPGNPAGDGTPNATGLCAGNWSVTIADANGCDTTIQFTIAEPLPLALTPGHTDVTCGNNCDGTANAAVTGGTPGYTYTWAPVPGAGQGTAAASGLCAGTWTLTVEDANGCSITQAYTILPAVPMDATLQRTPASCAGACDGEAEATVAGGVAPYTYLWDPAPAAGQGTPHATGLCAGPGSLTITDGAGCDTTIQFTIAAPPAINPNGTATDPPCAGSCGGTILLAPTGGNGSYTYQWTPVPPNGDGTAQATGLCPGTYAVRVSSGGCDTTLSFTLLPPPPIDVQLASTPATCAEACNGTATLSGTLAGLTFAWTPAPGGGQGTANATGLCPGPGSVTVTNAQGCDTVITFTILAPAPLAVGTTTTDAGCGTACDGTATLAVSGGTPAYTYLWSPAPGSGQGTATAGGLCPGVYTATVTDAAGCDTTVEVIIARPAPIAANAAITPASCADACDGALDVAASGGVAPYTWAWTPAPGSGQGTGSVGGLCPGDWTVVIGDQAGCDTSITFTLAAPAPLDPHGTFTNESCLGPCDGTATVAPTGGSGTFTYTWSPAPPSGQGTAAAGGLCAGDWCVTISDAAGCDTTWCFTLLPVEPIVATVATSDGGCWGSCSGEATVTATGGAGGFSYLWAPAPAIGQGTATASGLCEGPGSVTITDAGGCDTTITFHIANASPIEAHLEVSGATCMAACSGTAGATPTGGAGGYTFQWSPEPATGQGTAAVTGLCAGTTYALTITDANTCDTTVQFTVPAYVPVEAQVAATAASCTNACDGAASVTAPTGGVAPYTYVWGPAPAAGQGTAQASGFCPGPGQVTIADVKGCDTTLFFTIAAPAPIDPQPTVSPIGCGGECTGAIDLATTGGSGGFIYTWSPAPAVGQGTAHAGQLCAGTWTVTIADASGCDTTLSFVLDQPAPLNASAEVGQSQCNVCDGSAQLHTSGGTGPYQFHWGPPLNTTTGDSVMTGLCAGVYAVQVTDAAGCSVELAVAVADSDGETITATGSTTTCPGACDGSASVAFTCSAAPCTVAWSDMGGNAVGGPTDSISALCAGSYIVAVTNGAGCVTLDTAAVVEPAPLVANISTIPESCTGLCNGTATIGIAGGVGPFTFTWSPEPGSGQGTPHATGLCAGTYQVLVHDQGGCDATFDVLIPATAPITVDAAVTGISCSGLCDGAIAVDAAGGSGAFIYTWAPAPPNGQGTATASGLCAGTYTLTVADANGCDTTLSFQLAAPQPLALTGAGTLSHCTVCDGTASVVATGGTGSISVEWTQGGAAVGSGTLVTGLCAGIYLATATDSSGCSATQGVVVPDADGEAIQAMDGQTLCGNSCDGQVSVAYTCGDAPCTVLWSDLAGNSLAQQDTLSGLCTGTYLVQVTNASGCMAVDTALVLPSQTITPNLGTVPASCHNSCDATATVGPAGGMPPYSYAWSPEPSGGQGTPHATGLCAGVWQVTIADSTGCDTVVQVLITAPQPLAVNATVQQVNCAGACDGSIVLAPAGGTGAYTYLWSPMPPNGQGGSSALNLCPGDWTVTVSDVNGCDSTVTFTITEPPPLTVAATSTLSACAVCSGTATATPAGGTAPYTFAWLQGGLILGTGSSITGLCAGLYTLRVTDAHGCQQEMPVPVSDAGGEALATTDFNLTCPSDCNGLVTVAFTCTVPTCTIAWSDAAGNDLNEPGGTLANLCAGSYFVAVTNGAGCITVDTALVIAPDPIVANLGTTPVTCSGDCDGTATVGPTGGAGGYVFAWLSGPDTIGTMAQVTGLCAGTYSVTITDAQGCSITQGVLITAPLPITATAVVDPIACHADCGGSITVMGHGGTGALSYLWSPEPGGGQGTHTATGLCAGTWTVTIADVNGCDTTFSIVLADPAELVVAVSHTDNVCFTDCAATAHADITGGAGPYTITWEAPDGTVVGQDVTDVAALCGGDHVVSVTDANGCTVTAAFTVGTGAPIDANLSFLGESCFGPCDGSAAVAPSGGTGSGYSYLWQPGSPIGQGTGQVSGLCPGDYSVTITDGAGCDSTYAFTINPFQPIAAVAAVQQVQCSGACDGSISVSATGGSGALSYLWSPPPASGQGTAVAGGLCAGTWTVTISDPAGCDTTLVVAISEPPALSVATDNLIVPSCQNASDGAIAITVSGGLPGYTIAWNGPNGYSSADEDISGLAPGNYAVTATDLNNCQVTADITLGVQNAVVADAGADRTECAGTAVPLDGSASQGATGYQWTDADGNVVGTSAVVSTGQLPFGLHTFILTVVNGPCSDADTVVVNMLPLPIADAGEDRTILVLDSTILGGSPSGPDGSTFIWQPDSLLNDPASAHPVATPPATMWFHLTVIGPDGCVAQDSVLVTVMPTVKVPSGFTPNGDGHNDTWILEFASIFPGIEVQVFSRWGEPLFRSVGYATPWDGKYDGKLVPVGTYYYVVDLHDKRFPEPLTGPLTVIR